MAFFLPCLARAWFTLAAPGVNHAEARRCRNFRTRTGASSAVPSCHANERRAISEPVRPIGLALSEIAADRILPSPAVREGPALVLALPAGAIEVADEVPVRRACADPVRAVWLSKRPLTSILHHYSLSIIIKTQIQLPDDQYARLRALAARLEVSLAELLRRGADYVLTVYPAETTAAAEWHLPDALDLGEPMMPVESWRELANEQLPEDVLRSDP